MHAQTTLHMNTTSSSQATNVKVNNKLICVIPNYEGDVPKQHMLKVHGSDHNHNPGLISPVYNLFSTHPVKSR